MPPKSPSPSQQENIERESKRARLAKPYARVSAYEQGPYVTEKHINITTAAGDLAGSHLAAFAALKKAGIKPPPSRAGSIRLTVDEDMPLSQAKALVIAALKEAGIQVES